MTVQFLIYLGVGKLLLFLLQKFLDIKFLEKLISCDLCLGVWVFSILSWVLQIRLLEDVYFYIPIVSELITGSIVSFGMHLLSIGFREKFTSIVIE